VNLNPSLRNEIERRLAAAFGRIEGWVHKADVALDDINGPRGGVCKRCRVVVTTTGMGQVVVTETHASVYGAVLGAIRRVRSAVLGKAKHVQKRRMRSRRRSSQRLDDAAAANEANLDQSSAGTR
jgi:ribosome-associated translation inhibitor RaiA